MEKDTTNLATGGVITAQSIVVGNVEAFMQPTPKLVLQNFAGSGKNLVIPLPDSMENVGDEIRPFFEELYAIPGVKEIFEKHGVKVE